MALPSPTSSLSSRNIYEMNALRSRTHSHSIQRDAVPPEYPSQQSPLLSRTYSHSSSKQWNIAPPDYLSQWSPRQIATRPCILFYHKHDPYYSFTTFSAHPVYYKGVMYPTSQHLFQSFKFQEHRPDLADHIRRCSDRPFVAFSEARRLQTYVRPDWRQINISKMDETLWHKFTQHPDLRAELLATGDAELVENSHKDSFWGVGPDGQGRNELGKALERLRAKLREKP